MNEVLPLGWALSTIEDCVNKLGLFTDGDWIEKKDQDINGRIRLLQLADVGDGKFIDKSSKYINENTFKKLNCTEVFPGDILLARMPQPLGRACILPSINYRAITAVDVCIIRPCQTFINPIWLHYFINAAQFRNRISELSSGTTRKRISRKNLGSISLFLPPLNEQKRIVAKLDKIIPRIVKVKERLDKIPVIIKRFRQSVLTAAVTGKLTEEWRKENPDVESGDVLLEKIKKKTTIKSKKELKFCTPFFESAWDFIRLGVLFQKGDIFDGPFGSNLKTSDYTTQGVSVIRLENIGFLAFDKNKKTFISKEKYESLKRHTVFEGDIIFSSFITKNVRTVVLPKLETTSIAKADCFCMRLTSSCLDKKYLTLCMSSKPLHDYLKLQVHGATRPRINTEQLRTTPIPLPPLEEQKEIVRQVDNLFTLADKLETHYQKAKAKVDKLSQSVLAKAFRGELVPQDPNDEPAEKLLERIMKEKAKMEAELKKTKKKKSRKKAKSKQ
jgi:type I restriction enzyme S subunit